MVLGLVERVSGDGLGVRGIEGGGLVEVVGEPLLGGFVLFRSVKAHLEFGLGWCPGRKDERGPSGLSDAGQDLGDGCGLGQECDEGQGGIAQRADEGRRFLNTGQEGGPSGGPGGACARCSVFGALAPLAWEGRPWGLLVEEEGDRGPERREGCPPGPGP